MKTLSGIMSFAILVILQGCQTGPLKNPLDNPIFEIPAQSQLQLNQAVEFPVGYSRSFIQFGQPVVPNQVNIRYENCHFYRRDHPDDLERVRTLQPDRFTITKTVQTEDIAASTGLIFSMGFSIGTIGVAEVDGPPDVDMTTILYLQSKRNPEVVQLRCSIYTEPSFHNHLTANEIKKVLGEVATLDVKL